MVLEDPALNVFNLLWHNLHAIGHIFIAENGQILKTQFGHLVSLVGVGGREDHKRQSNSYKTDFPPTAMYTCLNSPGDDSPILLKLKRLPGTTSRRSNDIKQLL